MPDELPNGRWSMVLVSIERIDDALAEIRRVTACRGEKLVEIDARIAALDRKLEIEIKDRCQRHNDRLTLIEDLTKNMAETLASRQRKMIYVLVLILLIVSGGWGTTLATDGFVKAIITWLTKTTVL